jgi:hypothetical protein
MMCREVDGENPAAFRGILSRNMALKFGEYVFADGQTQAGSASLGFGGVERFE